MSALLRSDNPVEENDVKNNSQLIGYAAEHWATHAKYGNVPSFLRKAMEYLFDLDKPYFAAWRQLHDIDTESLAGSTFYYFTPWSKSDAVPLYYAALCGFKDLVEHLIRKCPQHVNVEGGYYVTPLVAALGGEHFQTAKILRDNGADPNVRGFRDGSPLHSAAYYGDLRMVQVLLEYNADINAPGERGRTPLHYLSKDNSSFEPRPQISQLHNVSRFLLEHGADINARINDLSTPLHLAARHGRVEVVRVLLEHGASVGAEDKKGRTPLQLASFYGHSDTIKLLSEHGAK
jgi:ankyrin repeat protein